MPKEQDIGAPVRDLYAALNTQDPGAFDRCVSERVEYTDFGLGQRYSGREAFKKHFKIWWAAFPKGTGEIKNLITSGNWVVVEVTGKGEQSGVFEIPSGRIEPTNRPFEFHFCQIFEIRDGVIARGHSYSDAFQLFAGSVGARKAA